jgi:hypothetical protein
MSEETTDSVVTSSDVAKKTPTSFRDLNKAELVAAAQAFGTNDEGTAKDILTDLADAGVTWEMYVKQFNLEVSTKPEQEIVVVPPLDEFDDYDAAEEVEQVEEIVVATPETFQASKYLVKFIGENPYFEFGKYRFTQDKPYGIMTANDAQSALVSEPTKFRQAFPNELEEFYS